MPSPELEARARRARREHLFEAGALPAPVGGGRAVIERILPHRGPMLLLDELEGVDPAQGRLAARRQIRADDRAFEGHFPGQPVYPGVLQVEMAGQLGLCVKYFLDRGSAEVAEDARPAPVRLMRVLDASFLGEVRPNDALEVLAEVVEDDGQTFTAIGQVLRGGAILSVSMFTALMGGLDE